MKRLIVIGAAALALGFTACTENDRFADATDDATITANVEEELIDERIAGNIQVSSAAGVVTLNGTVPNADARERAEEVADDVDGVDRVVNNLRTTMAGDAPDLDEGTDIPGGAMNPPPANRPPGANPPPDDPGM